MEKYPCHFTTLSEVVCNVDVVSPCYTDTFGRGFRKTETIRKKRNLLGDGGGSVGEKKRKNKTAWRVMVVGVSEGDGVGG